ncbi:MAG: RnfH family protein [Herminiimonas sp.]|nr:RnfH family protein [Herminiimonas sp.]
MAEQTSVIRVQVCHATPAQQFLRTVDIGCGSTMQMAIDISGVLDACPEIHLDSCKTGLHGKLRPRDTVLRDGDRVEIYRPLIADPMEARRRRAEKKVLSKAG